MNPPAKPARQESELFQFSYLPWYTALHSMQLYTALHSMQLYISVVTLCVIWS